MQMHSAKCEFMYVIMRFNVECYDKKLNVNDHRSSDYNLTASMAPIHMQHLACTGFSKFSTSVRACIITTVTIIIH